MKVLVTGGAGFIGSHVSNLYISHGYDVVIVDDLSTGRLSNINPEATFYQMDICDPQLKEIFAKERPDFINHHAAQMNVRRSVSDPLFDASVNVVGSLNLLECAKLFGVQKFIYISTGGAVYGEPEYLPCDEAHPINPICQYGASKHTVEHYLYMYHENYGLDYTVLRYPNVYGPRQDPYGEAGVIAIFTGQMLAGEQVTINGDGEQTRDYVYVEDCARANLMATASDEPTGIFNLGSGRGTSVNEIFDALKRLTGYPLESVHGPAKVGETRHIYLDASKVLDTFGWSPRWILEEGLEQTLAFFRENEVLTPISIRPPHRPAEMMSESTVVGDSDTKVWKRHSEAKVEESDKFFSIASDRKMNGRLDVISEYSLETSPLEEILGKVITELDAASGSIFLVDEEMRIRKAAFAYDGQIQTGSTDQLEKSFKQGLSCTVFRQGSAVLLESTHKDERWLPSEWESETRSRRSVISVPLFISNRVVGVLTLARPEKDGFARSDLAMLITISALVSLAEVGLRTSDVEITAQV
jgi:UDP-glucose 4-epimerase